ncbi:sensor histidine kinase [Helcococcus massiliensis]|uniref:sensor histidine kinase n=1 Tax=Helcococcus massiliensis TaxID=2040290 RepID=UPI000CDED370|nr:HAMP domain-containing sensor histidine kinase [Helcococcus massiliensis]
MNNKNKAYSRPIIFSILGLIILIFSLGIVNVDISQYTKADIGASPEVMNQLANLRSQLERNGNDIFGLNDIEYQGKNEIISNRPFTKDYMDKHNFELVVKTNMDEILGFESEDEYKEYLAFRNASVNKLVTYDKAEDEELVNVERNTIKKYDSTSDFSSIEDISSAYAEKSILIIGLKKSGDEEPTVLTNKDDFKDDKIKSYAENIIKDFNYIFKDNDESKNLELISFYDLNENSFLFRSQEQYINTGNILIKILGGTLAFTLIIFIYIMALNYHKLKENDVFEGLKRIPIEVVIISLPIILVVAISLLKNIVDSSQITDIIYRIFENKLVFTLTLTVAFTVLTMLITYFSLGLKSIYYKGYKTFLIQNSIIYKIGSWIVRKIKTMVLSFLRLVDISDRKVFVGIFALILGFWFIFSVLLFNSPRVFVIGLIPLLIFFKIAKKIYGDIREIQSISEEYSVGNYESRVSEENSLKKLSANINKAGESLETAVEKQIESQRMKTELVTNVSHDLKTPLTSIINYSQLINDENTDIEDVKKYAETIHQKSLRLKALIESLFEVSKLNSNNVDLHFTDIDLREIFNQALGEWIDKFEDKELELIVNIPDEEEIVSLDGQQTYRIFENVFSNIYKYALEGTRVYMDMKDKTITIKNISKYALNISPSELMERFKRGDESRNTEGSGLGLSIASSLTDLQNGRFTIDIIGDLFIVKIEF